MCLNQFYMISHQTAFSKSIFWWQLKSTQINNLNEAIISNETIKLDRQIRLNEAVKLVLRIAFYLK